MASYNLSIGIIGGSGIYNMPGTETIEDIDITTPFGKTSDKISVLKVSESNVNVAFIPRHGKGHVLTPTEVPYQANIWALKKLGVKYIISVSAVGSLQKELEPGHICIPDQIIDLTTSREKTFFKNGIAGHVSMAEPYCSNLSKLLYDACINVKCGSIVSSKKTTHLGGTLTVIEGPRFSTKAESEKFRNHSGPNSCLVGMTGSPEAFLAKEAEISFAVIAHVTDYDSWNPDHDNVTVEQVISTFGKNTVLAQKSVKEAIKLIEFQGEKYKLGESKSFTALGNGGAIMTKKECVKDEVVERLRPIIGEYYK